MVILKSYFQFGRRIWNGYNRDSGPLMSAAIAFYGLLSLLPLLSLGVYILGLILGADKEALPRLHGSIAQVLPGSSDLIYGALGEIKHDPGLAGVIGFTGLILSASAIFSNMELAFNNMWNAESMRPWWRQKAVAIAVMTATVALILGSLAITSALAWLQSVRVAGIDLSGGRLPALWNLAGGLTPAALSIIAFALIYKVVPNCRITWRRAFAGALFAGLAWEAAKYLFTLYIARFADYSKVYGSLGAVISLMFWAYYSSTILFLGGEIAAGRGHHEPRDEPAAAGIPHPQPREGES